VSIKQAKKYNAKRSWILNSYIEATNFFKKAYALESIKRYSSTAVIRQESVASHSYFVALGVRLLHNVYRFDLQKALVIALSHDMAEIATGDVTYAVKRKYPKIAAAIAAAELEAAKAFPECIRNDMEMYHEDSVERMMCKLADCMQVVQYATSEIELGNDATMPVILNHTLEREHDLKVELEKYHR